MTSTPHSIKKKFMKFITLLIVSSALIFIAIDNRVHHKAFNNLKKEQETIIKDNVLNTWKSKVLLLSNLLTKSLVQPLYTFNLSEIRNIAQIAYEDNNLNNFCVLDEKSIVIYNHKRNDKIGKIMNGLLINKVMQNRETIIQTKDHFITSLTPIIFKSKLIGILYIDYSLEEVEIILHSLVRLTKTNINNLTQECIINTILGLIFFIGISFFATNIFVLKFFEPISDLMKGTEEIMKGNLTYKIKTKSKDEIGAFAQSFNKMTCSLEQANLKVQKEISMRKKTEKHIKHMNSQLQQLSQVVEQSPLCILITNTDWKITYVNPRFKELTGFQSKDLIGKDASQISFTNLASKEYLRMIKNIQSGGQWKGELCHKKKNDETFWELATVLPIKDSSGKTINFLKLSEDLTDRKKLETALFQSQKMESIGQLAGGIAHDFNNIISTIINFVFLSLNKLDKTCPTRQYLETIQQAAEKASNLTQSLLAFSRKQIINSSVICINSVIEKMENILSRLIGEDIIFDIELSKTKIKIFADVIQVEQLLMNIASNARDAMPNGGHFKIKSQTIFLDSAFINTHNYGKQGDYLLITFEDTGIGIDKSIINNIFEPFFTTKEVNKGTGLGLSTVYGIVQQNEGYITVDSEVGVGTIIKTYFPQVYDEESYSSMAKIINKEGKGETILLAEDDTNLREGIKNILEESGYNVIEATDGMESLKIFEQNSEQIDLVILDVVMPILNGKQVFDSMININPKIKVLFTSGYSFDIISRKGLFQDDVEFISKPIQPLELLNKINIMLSLSNTEEN